MNQISIKYTLLLFILCSSCNLIFAQQGNRQFYQLKTYTFSADSQVEQADKYFKNAYLPALKRQNIENIGVFKPKTYAPEDTLQRIIVLIPFASLEEFESLDTKLLSDKTYQKEGAAFIGAPHDKKPYERISSIVLKAFEDMPLLKPSPLTTPREERVYELRSYQSPTVALHQNKVDMFNAGGEVALFDKLGFNAVFYSSVVSGPDMPNLMYMTTFKDQASRDAHWEAFGTAPVWKKLSALPKYQDNVSHIDITYLYPTEYSDY
ncbi:NIPSNAP family protein [Flavimarina sp. Hel_I_48]|uniref:NIPSNAP family protein n=1 Tax=Flavimarina sp. Hel_I_48 TaxID=1392488 RepID=UPI0004DEDE5D|nr:NIPSNAP family protein [Flavimarina sp. Hel_I_48]